MAVTASALFLPMVLTVSAFASVCAATAFAVAAATSMTALAASGQPGYQVVNLFLRGIAMLQHDTFKV